MRARIAYLTGLARQTAGQLPLRPPNRLFASDVIGPMRFSDRRVSRSYTGDAPVGGGPGPVSSARVTDEPPPSRQARPSPDADARRHRSDVRPPTAALLSTPATAASDVSAIPAAPPVPAAPVGAASKAAGRAGQPAGNPKPPMGPAVAEPATDVPLGLLAPPSGLVPSGAEKVSPRTATDLTVAKSSTAVPDPPRASPLDPARADQPQATEASGSVPAGAMPPTRRGGLPAQSHEQFAAADAPDVWPPGFEFLGTPVELPQPHGSVGAGQANPLDTQTAQPRIGHAREDDAPSRAAIHDLLPVPAPAIEQPAGLAGGSRRDVGATSGARLSIGTIEVTVVPPRTPAVRDVRKPAQTAPSRPRAGSALAMRPGSDRLRDGLRRWYGTAQG